MKTLVAFCLAFSLVVFPQIGAAQSDQQSLISGFWTGAYRVDAQEKPSACYLEAYQSDDKISIVLLWNHIGLHIVLHSEKWSLIDGEEYLGRVVIDKRFDKNVEAQNSSEQSIDYIFGYDEKAREAIQAGNSIAMEGPAGKVSFRLQGTRKAINVIMGCAQEYFAASQQAEPANTPNISDGSTAFNEGDYTLALANWLPLAIQGDARAQTYLGEMYRDGDGVKEDFEEAARLFHLAAAQDSMRAQNALGLLYYKGKGVPLDHAEAAHWFERAAELGYASGQNNLAEMYRDGEGVAQSSVQAMHWFQEAANQGNARAQESLDAMLSKFDQDEAQPPTNPVPAVTPAPSVVLEPSVVPSSQTFDPGETIAVQFTNLPAKGQDWLAVSSISHSPEQYFELVMLEGKPTNGSLSFKPLPVGEYEVRLYTDWPNGGYEIVAASKFVVATKVVPVQPAPPQPVQASPTPAEPVPAPASPIEPVAEAVDEVETHLSKGVSGEWIIHAGMFDAVSFDQVMDLVEGVSIEPVGQIEGEVKSGRLTGHWVSSDETIGKKCETLRLGVSNWGLIEAELSEDEDLLSGAWSECDQFMTNSFQAARVGSAAALALDQASQAQEEAIEVETPAPEVLQPEVQASPVVEPVAQVQPKKTDGYSFDENGILVLNFELLPDDPFVRHFAPKVPSPNATELANTVPSPGAVFAELEPPLIAPETPLGLGEQIPAWDSWPLVNLGGLSMEQIVDELNIENIVAYDWLATVYPENWKEKGLKPYAIDGLAKRDVYGGDESKTPPLTGWSSYKSDRLTKYVDGQMAGVEFEFSDSRLTELRTNIEGGRFLEIQFISGSNQVATVTNQNGWEIADGKQFDYFPDGTPKCVRGRKGYPEEDMYRNHGRTACLDQSGYLLYEQFYDDADFVGSWKEYADGRLREISNYSQDRTEGIQVRYSGANLSYWGMYQTGKRNGPYVSYVVGHNGENHPDEKGTYVDDDKNGFLWRYQQGELSYVKRMNAGREIALPFSMETDTGLIQKLEILPTETHIGQVLLFDYDGLLYSLKNNDEKGTQGVLVEIEDGYLLSRIDYLDGKKHGLYLRYYTGDDGVAGPLELVETYVNGELKGPAIRFWDDGSLDYKVVN